MAKPSNLIDPEKAEIMKASLEDITTAMNLNELPKEIEEGGQLRDKTLVAGVEGTAASRNVHRLGFDITEHQTETRKG